MQWTNLFRLPQPLAEAIMEDLYYGKREAQLQAYLDKHGLKRDEITHFSVGELIKSPRQVLLQRRHFGEIIKDVAQEVFRILGTAVHLLLWFSAKRINDAGGKSYYEAEDRLFFHFTHSGSVVVVSGEPDLVHDNCIDDYKVTGVWSWLKGIKKEWEKQLNLYAMFRTMNGKLTTKLRICYILRDWNVNETVQGGYPPVGCLTEEVRLWSYDEQLSFLNSRINAHMAVREEFDDDLPECSSEEMWAKEDAYAVKRKGNKVASRVFSSKKNFDEGVAADPGFSKEDAMVHTLKEAEAYASSMNSKLKGKEAERDYYLEFRPGERTRCLRFCDARQFCSQFKEYSQAAFRDEQPAEKV